jgi:hypothetical protein
MSDSLMIQEVDSLLVAINKLLVRETNILENMISYLLSKPEDEKNRILVYWQLIKKKPTKEQLKPLKPLLLCSMFCAHEIPPDEFQMIKHLLKILV